MEALSPAGPVELVLITLDLTTKFFSHICGTVLENLVLAKFFSFTQDVQVSPQAVTIKILRKILLKIYGFVVVYSVTFQ